MIKILTLIVFLPTLCFTQKQGNIWYFGDHAGLDFNSGTPVLLEDGQTSDVNCPACHSEGTAVIADSSGSLLFYCDGSKIWNKHHEVMPNGSGLLSNVSATQSSLIIPLPGSSRYFYVFTVDDFYFDNLQHGFSYSVVDLCLDNGNGDVVSDKKNIPLLNPVAEKLTAVRHSNGTDYWIIVHKYYSDAFHAYHLSSIGIINTIISNVGSVHPAGTPMNVGGAQGQLKASPNGQKLALVNSNSSPTIAEYFDFNAATGTVSNPVALPIGLYDSHYGVSFSPDNSKLYIACTMNCNGVYQFDLNAGNVAAISASKTLISNVNANFLGLQLASNGKIYVARSPFAAHSYLSVINHPNNPGTSCNYVDSAVNLNGHHAGYGFPNFVDSYSYSNEISKCDFAGFEDQEFELSSIYPNPFTLETTINLEHYLENGTLTIYNAFGQKIKEIDNIGGQMIKLQRDQMSAGVYVIRLVQYQKILFTKKLVITD